MAARKKSIWPTQDKNYNTELEEKRIEFHTTMAININGDIIERFSDLSRSLRFLSYVIRFFQRTHPNTKASFQARSCSISADEIKAMTQRLIIICHKQHYGQEYSLLKSKKPASPKSEILPINRLLTGKRY